MLLLKRRQVTEMSISFLELMKKHHRPQPSSTGIENLFSCMGLIQTNLQKLLTKEIVAKLTKVYQYQACDYSDYLTGPIEGPLWRGELI